MIQPVSALRITTFQYISASVWNLMKDSGSCSLSPEEVGISQSDRHSRIPIELFCLVGPAVFFCGNINTLETPEMIDDLEIDSLDLEFNTTSRCQLPCQVASSARVPNYLPCVYGVKTGKTDHVFVCICATRHESNTRLFRNIQLNLLHLQSD